MKIIYVHHAERNVSKDHLNSELRQLEDITETGIKEAEFLAERLKKQKVKAIVTSPYLRCKHTSEILNKYINVPIIEDSLIEESRDEIRSELSIFKDKVDALVLGCTHYPSLSKTIKEYLNVPLIDMGKCLTEVLELSLEGETVIDLYFSEISDKLISNVSNILECEYNLQGKVLDNKLLS